MFMYKRGELTSQQIAILVLAIGGFVLVFLFLFAIFDNQSLTERELCSLSFLERASLPAYAGNVVPIQCTTEKICITLDKSFITVIKEKLSSSPAAVGVSQKSDCKQFAGEENVRIVKVKLGDVGQQAEAIRTIEKENANAMFDCWTMTGQGKLDIFRGESESAIKDIGAIVTASLAGSEFNQVLKNVKPKCVVCSRVALSEQLVEADNSFNILSKIDLNRYMAHELVPGKSLTYLQALTDESIRSYSGVDKFDSTSENSFTLPSKVTDELAIIFMQIKTEGDPTEIASQAALMTTGTIIAGGGILGVTKKFSLVRGVSTLLNKIPGVKAISFIAQIAAIGGSYLGAKAKVEDNQAISVAACGGVEKGKDKNGDDISRLGCSLVKQVSWNVESVNDMCFGGIEGNL